MRTNCITCHRHISCNLGTSERSLGRSDHDISCLLFGFPLQPWSQHFSASPVQKAASLAASCKSWNEQQSKHFGPHQRYPAGTQVLLKTHVWRARWHSRCYRTGGSWQPQASLLQILSPYFALLTSHLGLTAVGVRAVVLMPKSLFMWLHMMFSMSQNMAS